MNKYKLKSESLSRQIFIISFAVSLVSVVLMMIIMAVYQRQAAITDLLGDIEVTAAVLGNQSEAALIFADNDAAQANLASAQYRQGIHSVCLYDASSKLFAQYLKFKQQSVCPPATNQLIASDGETNTIRTIEESGLLRVQKSIVDSQSMIGSITISASPHNVNERISKAIYSALLPFALILLVSFLILRRLLNVALRPLTQLRETAAALAESPFSSRRAQSARNDEVGMLVRAFNAMLDRLGDENQALQTSEARFRSLAKHSPVGIYQLDKDGVILYANDRWRQLTAIDDPAACYFPDAIDPNVRPHYKDALAAAKASLESQVVEYQFIPKNSTDSRIFLEYITPILSSDTSGKQELTGYIGSLLDITAQKNAQIELEHLAFYDPLTNLPNRRFFKDSLHRAVEDAKTNKTHVALMLMDLDNFKRINDTLGHDAGDELLSVLAKRLRSVTAKKDIVARMGGDEFIVLIRDLQISDLELIQQIGKRLLSATGEVIEIGGQLIEATASIGVAVYPKDAASAEELVRNADLSLYLSKGTGRNRLSFFSNKLELVAKEKLYIERKLRDALKNDALSFYIQPQWHFGHQQVNSGEILIRWFDDDDGFIPPDKFIPVAEETGLIIQITLWLIESVFEALATHRNELKSLGIQTIAINLSAREFFNSKLISTVERALAKHNIPPGLIEFELTESAVMEDIEEAIRIMNALKDLGCYLSIDDFGTGYSSLEYLKRFPLDALKIDRSFIMDIPNDPNDIEISSAIIAMGHNLGLSIVAEGVETQEQLDFLVENNCDFAQGYYLARPMPFADFITTVPDINNKFAQESSATKSAG